MISIKTLVIISFCLVGSSCTSNHEGARPSSGDYSFVRAMDISFLPEIEGSGVTFYDDMGIKSDLLTLIKAQGCNTVRIRLWHSPSYLCSGFDEVEAFVKRIEKVGLQVWLDFHYSDSWADPHIQEKPKAWQSLSWPELKDSFYRYTRDVIASLKPDFVQIGNEIDDGILWPDGSYASARQQFIELLEIGLAAAKSAHPRIKTIIHHGRIKDAAPFFETLAKSGLDYDIVALSYYPVWHGTDMGKLDYVFDQLNKLIGKPVLIAETAYPFSLNGQDSEPNVTQSLDQTISQYTPSQEGQLAYMLALRKLIEKNGGLGFCYWAPEWVSFKSKGPYFKNGSIWENMALFDFDGRVTKAIKAFNN